MIVAQVLTMFFLFFSLLIRHVINKQWVKHICLQLRSSLPSLDSGLLKEYHHESEENHVPERINTLINCLQ